MHSVFRTLCNPPVWWSFSAAPPFLPQYLLFHSRFSISFFFFFFCFFFFFFFFASFLNSFLSCWWSVMTGALTNYFRETHLPFHFRQNVFQSLSMTWYTTRFGCRYSISNHFWSLCRLCPQTRHFVLIFNFDLCFLWFLIGYEGRYQSKKNAGTLDKIKRRVEIWRNCRCQCPFCNPFHFKIDRDPTCNCKFKRSLLKATVGPYCKITPA